MTATATPNPNPTPASPATATTNATADTATTNAGRAVCTRCRMPPGEGWTYAGPDGRHYPKPFDLRPCYVCAAGLLTWFLDHHGLRA